MSTDVTHDIGHNAFVSSQDGLRQHVREYGTRIATGPPVICLPGLARTLADIDIERPLPPRIIALLQKQIAEIVVMPDVKAMLDKLSFQPVGSTSAQFADQIKTDIVVWSNVMKDANIPVN
jgi:hypothetical protein